MSSPETGAAPATLASPGARLADWLPILEWLPRYERAWLKDDLLSALTVWALVVPQSIAYAQIAGLPPQSGLLATFAGLLGYALLGTSRQLVVSPTSSTAAISASLVGTVAAGSTSSFEELSSALAVTLGIVFVVMGIARLGFVSRFIPMPVTVGFMFGLGMTIIVGQLAKVIGVPGAEGSFIEQTIALIRSLPDISLPTVAIGVASLIALFAARRFAPGLPIALLVVIGSIVAVAALGLVDRGVEVIGVIDGGFPVPALPIIPLVDLFALIPGAIAIAVMGYAETVQVADAFADEHDYEIRPDQELIANGGANVLAGLFQAFIVGGGASQSAAADRSGARTLLVSLIVSALAVLTLVALLPLFRDLPQAALGAIVISAVIGFLNVEAVRRLAALRRSAILLALASLIGVLLFGILAGLILAVILTLAMVLTRIARAPVTVLGRTAPDRYEALERHPDAARLPGVLVVRLDAPMIFLNAKLLSTEVRRQVATSGEPIRLVVLDMAQNSDIDIESRDLLDDLGRRLASTGTELRLADVRAIVRGVLRRPDHHGQAVALPIYPSVAAAVAGDPTVDERS